MAEAFAYICHTFLYDQPLNKFYTVIYMSLPSLYGIKNSNRSGSDLWGKNQFNSTFPAALCCYMRDHKINPIYISTDSHFQASANDQILTFDDVFNTTLPNENLEFSFESNFDPYGKYLHDALDHIDLVIKENGNCLRPLEVKLTVLPDNNTSTSEDEGEWGSELVIRPDSISYACLGIYENLKQHTTDIRSIIEPTAIRVEQWTSAVDIQNNAEQILNTLTTFFSKYAEYQVPFLIQPIWKTKGKSPELSDNAFDVFVWSDFALCKLSVEQAQLSLNRGRGNEVSRFLRSAAKTIRALNELFTTQRIHVGRIFRGMTLGNQTDKEFALSGRITRNYMAHSRLKEPILKKSILKKIILNGGERELSPERRFDATIFFTARNIFEGTDE
jgi:hypothetical protein